MTSTTDTSHTPATHPEILEFWFADGLQKGWPSQDMKELWWGGSKGLDETVKAKFGNRVAEAVAGGLKDWEAEPLSRLALVLLLDQFTRNVYRGSGKAFSGDARAQQLVTAALADGWDKQLPWVGRVFFYMPLMHAEDLSLQQECVQRFKQLALDAPDELKQNLAGNADFAVQHKDIIEKFGRFPYRNAALGRSSTPAEEEFLKTGPRFGQ
ncbi:MAG: DUF924 family protein [Pseudomonadota bacterium]